MSRKSVVGIVVLAVISVMGAVSSAAQGAPFWYKKAVLVGPAPIVTTTSGVLKFTALGLTVVCKVNDTEEIWNPVTGAPGEDLVTAFAGPPKCKSKVNAACPPNTAEIAAAGLPWPSHLIPGTPVRDEIQKIRLQLKCLGAVVDEFEGALTPEVGSGDLGFGGPGGGTLFDGALNPMTIVGKDTIKAPPGTITAL